MSGLIGGVSRGRSWDTSISPQEKKRRHDAAERDKKKRKAKVAAERAALLRQERKIAEARADRTPEQQAIVDAEVRRLEARPSLTTTRSTGDWARAFSVASGRRFRPRRIPE